MNNSNYNSLAKQLMDNGILFSDNEENKTDSEINFFETAQNDTQDTILPHKRLNDYDLELINSTNPVIKDVDENKISIIQRFLNIKEKMSQNGKLAVFEYLFSKLCPKIYRAKLIKQALQKLLDLNIDTKILLDKTIPYGENELRYNALVKYLNCANEMQAKLK